MSYSHYCSFFSENPSGFFFHLNTEKNWWEGPFHNTNEKKYPISDIQFTNLDFLLCGKNQSRLWFIFYYLDWDWEKTPGMSSFVTIGHELWIILTVRTTYHFLVCSTFHRSIMKDTNTTVGYPYNYHYCTYVQCFFFTFMWHQFITY